MSRAAHKTTTKTRGAAAPCACGGGVKRLSYEHCCQPLHQGKPAPTAEALMRSRYSAYALGNMAYVAETWHASTRPSDLAARDSPRLQWIDLRVLQHHTALDGQTATVEFVATYRLSGKAHKLAEVSGFVFENGRWWYVDALTGEGGRA